MSFTSAVYAGHLPCSGYLECLWRSTVRNNQATVWRKPTSQKLEVKPWHYVWPTSELHQNLNIVQELRKLKGHRDSYTDNGRINREQTTAQQTQNIWMTFVQCWSSVEDAGPTLYKCHTNVCVYWVISDSNDRKIQYLLSVFPQSNKAVRERETYFSIPPASQTWRSESRPWCSPQWHPWP